MTSLKAFFILLAHRFLIFFSKFISVRNDNAWEKFIDLNNAMIRKRNFSFAPNEVLVILPHCLQKNKCDLRITNDIENCRECGICNIAQIKKLLSEYGVKGRVVTGGTLARMVAKEETPKGIVAVACPHDLAEGISLVHPTPVYGVLNERPEGPCINTVVDVEKIRKGIEIFLNPVIFENSHIHLH
jgi:uncharacterized protein